MFVGTMGLLLVPKLLGCLAVVVHGHERRGFGGTLRLVAGMLLETLIAGLMAPVVMLTQSIDVVAILFGRDSGWNAQRRDDGGMSTREVWRLYRRHTLLGVALGVAAWMVSLSLALWMLPVVVGLALAIPLALLTGRPWSFAGLLRTPEDAEPPEVVARAASLQREWLSLAQPGVAQLLRDPRLFQAHAAMLPPPRRRRGAPIDAAVALGRAKLEEAETLDDALSALSPSELAAVLGDAPALRRLSESSGG
jgi:membrane glycosyltransferase